ncbi:RsmB/NOP family class I SAM-dependent RNA methyltransferase [Roseococcus sp. DSY-14]|uniref:RsmB/NOP family class I SAM-dependent RNA methyltransferase n=1 Tax=Roseococcus sp. DSY-14 TaxID=3369650 RepID=UPI00387B5D61
MTPEARIAAAIALLEGVAAQPRRPADAIAAEFFRARRFIGGGDRRAVSDLAWGALRQRLRLEWHLAAVGAPATPRLLVLAQMVLGQKVPAAAALRAFAGGRFGPEAASPAEAAAARALEGRPLADPAMPEGPRLNLPEWALPGLRRRFGEALAAEAAALEGVAPLDLRANALKATRAAVLAGLGAPAEATRFSPWGVRLPPRTSVAAHPLFKDGAVEVQDEGSQLIAALVGAQPGMRVADYCAGAAGKTLAMAASMDNRGRIVACDVSAARLAGADKRLRRAGVHNAETHLLSPGDRWAKRRAGQFDRVLVDAPCTGTGTWRRNPDARVRTTGADLAELVAKQGEILSISAQLVRPGGRLAYATCSLLPEEDEDQVERFLAANPAFQAVPLSRAWAEAGLPGAPPCDGPHLALSPAAHGTDGFFCAVLERAG